MKKCPSCGGENREDATVCKFCNHSFPPGSPGDEKETSSVRRALPFIVLLIFVAAVCVLVFMRGRSNSGTSSSSHASEWHCTEFDAPYRVVSIKTEADVYGGVDEPSPSSVKGHVTGGAGGVEASCSRPGVPTFYRLRGVDWWGWVKTSDTQ